MSKARNLKNLMNRLNFLSRKSIFIYLFTSIILLNPMLSYAIFCPTNFNLIQTGDTIDRVLELCGKPDKQTEATKKAEGAQEWSYFIPQVVTTPSLYSTQGTLKTQISFDNSGKVINISVNGIGVGGTTICNGYNLQLGADREDVKRACGEPSFINKDENPKLVPPEASKETKVTTLFYNGGHPPSKLIFENGIFTEQQNQ